MRPCVPDCKWYCGKYSVGKIRGKTDTPFLVALTHGLYHLHLKLMITVVVIREVVGMAAGGMMPILILER